MKATPILDSISAGLRLVTVKVVMPVGMIEAAGRAPRLHYSTVYDDAVPKFPSVMRPVLMTTTDWWSTLDYWRAYRTEAMLLLADAVANALMVSTPDRKEPGEWHLPFVSFEDCEIAARKVVADTPRLGFTFEQGVERGQDLLRMVSAARCATIGRDLPYPDVKSFNSDLDLFSQLTEICGTRIAEFTGHQGMPDYSTNAHYLNPHLHGKFRGWCQYSEVYPILVQKMRQQLPTEISTNGPVDPGI